MKYFLVLAALLVSASTCSADPFVVCDPNPAASHYVVTGLPSCLGTGVNIPAQADGSVRLDVACVAQTTSWATKWKACNAWGDCSVEVPFALTRPGIPGAITGIRVSR